MSVIHKDDTPDPAADVPEGSHSAAQPCDSPPPHLLVACSMCNRDIQVDRIKFATDKQKREVEAAVRLLGCDAIDTSCFECTRCSGKDHAFVYLTREAKGMVAAQAQAGAHGQ